MQKRILFKLHHSLTMLTLKRLLLTVSICCLMATANAEPMDDALMDVYLKKRDFAEAFRMARPLAVQGSAVAQFTLGQMYQFGKGVTQDYKEAVKWYRLAAAQGHILSQYNIGVMYHNGQGVTKDYIRAHMWYNLSSSAGYAYEDLMGAAKNRDLLAEKMTPQQIEKAQDMARACQEKNFKGC